MTQEAGGGENDSGGWRDPLLSQVSDQEKAIYILNQIDMLKRVYIDAAMKEHESLLQFMREYGLRTITLLFAANAGAIAVLLALLGSIHSQQTPWQHAATAFFQRSHGYPLVYWRL